jgi:hypothetical protein
MIQKKTSKNYFNSQKSISSSITNQMPVILYSKSNPEQRETNSLENRKLRLRVYKISKNIRKVLLS